MKREFRLTRSADIKRVRREGSAFAHPLVVLLYLPNGGQQTRAAVIATRSVGKAVQRNRAKRRLRAALQPWLPRLVPGMDLVLLARKPVLEAPFADIETALHTLLHRANLLN